MTTSPPPPPLPGPGPVAEPVAPAGSTSLPALADALFDTVGLLRRQSRRLAGRPLDALSLSSAQLELVRVVRRSPGVSVAEAADLLGLAPNTVSTLVGQLVASDVIERQADPGDRRVARLHLTAEADRDVRAWRDRRGQATVAALAALDTTERAALAAALPIISRVAASLGTVVVVDDAAVAR